MAVQQKRKLRERNDESRWGGGGVSWVEGLDGLAGHFGRLGRGLLHCAVVACLHGVVGVGAAALVVVARVGTAAGPLVGVRAAPVALVGVGAAAVAVERVHAGARGRA